MIIFSDKVYLYGLLIIPILWFYFKFRNARESKRISEFASPNLLQKLTANVNVIGRKVRMILILSALALFVLALAGPKYGTHTIMVKRKGVDIIIAVDTSNSMLAEDNNRPPNRLTRAKYEIASLIDEKLKGDRIGIVAFAGDAFIQCPLTVDYSAAKMFLDILSTNLIPVQGTNIGKAIEVASKAFKEKEKQQKVLIIITDGENFEGDPVSAAKEAAKKGIIIYTIGIGNPAGEPIPMRDANGNLIGYKKDSKGNVVVSRLDENTLQSIAEAGNGKYFHTSPGGKELDKIYDEISGMEKKEFKGRLMTVYEERFQVPLIIGMILFAFGIFIPERKRGK